MKTRNFTLTVFAVFVSVTVSATKIPTLNVIPISEHKALIAFETAKPASVELTLKSRQGEILYCKNSEGPVNKIEVIFNFHKLNNGIYDVCLKINNYKISREIFISDNFLKKIGAEKKAFVPYCSFENDLLKISYLNNNQKNVLMNIYQAGEHITRKQLGKEMCIQKIFDLSKLEDGQYKVVLSNPDNEYKFVFNK